MDGKFFENNLFAVAGDTGRRLEVQLLDSNNLVQNTTGISLRLNAVVAGQATYAEATLVDAAKGLYELDLPNGMFLAPGNWQFQWQITDSAGKKLHSFAFTGNIGKNISEGGSQATNFYLNLEDLKAMQEDLVNGTIDSSILETNITEKLTNLETQYAPKLTEVTAQLAETTTKENETNFYDLLTRNSTDVGGHSIKVLSDRSLLATINLTNEDSVTLDLRKNINDDFIKFRNADLSTVTTGKKIESKSNYSTVLAGSITSTTGANHYTTVVGTKIEQVFKGTEISLTYYVDIINNRGGLWHCYIDGLKVKELSQHPNAVPSSDLLTASSARTIIASGLVDTQHTLVLEYMGQDPNNPITGARGWLRFNDNASSDPNNNIETFKWLGVSGGGETTVQVLYDSNKEFALSIDKTATNGNRQWFPEHNNLGTLFSEEQSLYVDGKKESLSVAAIHSFKEVKLLQKLVVRHPSFIGDVCSVLITATINYLGINFETKFEWLQNTYIHNGYVNMLTINPKFGDKLISSQGGEYDLNLADNTIEYLDEKIPYSFAVVSENYNNHYVTLSSREPKRSFRFGEIGTGGNADGTDYHYLQHRSADLQKLYPVTFLAYNAKAGEVFKFDGHFGFGFLPSVSEML